MTIIIFLIVLAVLVFVHELGHFLAAKRAGIRVDEFAIGFPPRLFSWKRGETLYSLNLIPIGGYVKIFGENPDEQSISGPDKERSFINKKRPIQASVLVAGVLGNIIFAWLLLSIGFMSGLPTSVEDKYADRFTDASLVIVNVYPETPAAISGIKTGDKIISATSGKNILSADNVNIKNFQEFVASNAAKSIDIEYERAGQTLKTKLTPRAGLIGDKPAIGVALDMVGTLKLPFFLAIFEGAIMTYDLTIAITKGLFHFVVDAFRGSADFSTVSGPVGIATIVGEVSRMGFVYLLSFTAVISINLAVINLVPFPALDGGRLLFVFIESIIRRNIKPSVSNAFNLVGFALLMLLMVVVTYKDIVKFF